MVPKGIQTFVGQTGIGIVGFVLSIVWGKVSGTRMSSRTIRILAAVWIGIALFGMIVGFFMSIST